MIYPWQTQQWQQVQRMIQSERLPHALLFKGAEGIGKLAFAQAFAQAMLCLQRVDDGQACGACHGCRQVIGDVHPDLQLITPEKVGQAIKVDQVRALNEFIIQSSLQGGFRVAIIAPAHAMNANAANALLKTLEEPSRDALIILVSEQNHRLPATILSRCQFVHFPTPAPQQSLAWLTAQGYQTDADLNVLLTLVNNAPLKVEHVLESDAMNVRQILFQALGAGRLDPVNVADQLRKHEPVLIIDYYLSWLNDLLRLAASVDVITNTDFIDQLQRQQQKHDAAALHSVLSYALQTRKLLSDGMNLNKQLVLEDLLIRWNDYVAISR